MSFTHGSSTWFQAELLNWALFLCLSHFLDIFSSSSCSQRLGNAAMGLFSCGERKDIAHTLPTNSNKSLHCTAASILPPPGWVCTYPCLQPLIPSALLSIPPSCKVLWQSVQRNLWENSAPLTSPMRQQNIPTANVHWVSALENERRRRLQHLVSHFQIFVLTDVRVSCIKAANE